MRCWLGLDRKGGMEGGIEWWEYVVRSGLIRRGGGRRYARAPRIIIVDGPQLYANLGRQGREPLEGPYE